MDARTTAKDTASNFEFWNIDKKQPRHSPRMYWFDRMFTQSLQQMRARSRVRLKLPVKRWVLSRCDKTSPRPAGDRIICGVVSLRRSARRYLSQRDKFYLSPARQL
jgi:hypothetical protein